MIYGMLSDEKISRLDELLNRFENELNRFEGSSLKSAESLIHEYENALKDAVSVLDATKQTFKSKQLKELRERIEAVLQQ